MSYLSSLIKTH